MKSTRRDAQSERFRNTPIEPVPAVLPFLSHLFRAPIPPSLPGSTRERQLLNSFARMLPELLRHSDRKDVLDLISEDLKKVHRPDDEGEGRTERGGGKEASFPPLRAVAASSSSLWGEEDLSLIHI